MKRKNMFIFLVCYFSYVSIYVARLNLSLAAPALKALDALDTTQLGMLGSLFSVVYACGRLLSGRIADQTPPWIMICTGLLFCGLGNLGVGFLPPFWAIFFLWGLNALAQSMLWGPILRILSAIYPEDVAKKRASYMGTAVAGGNLAAIALNNQLISAFGVQWAFWIPGTITLLFSALVLFQTRSIVPDVHPHQASSFRILFQHPSLRQMLLPAMIHGVMKDNISLWMTVYIMDCFGVDFSQSATSLLLIPALGFAGRLLAPYLYRFTHGRERPLLMVSFGCCAVCSVLLITAPFSAWIAVVYLSLIYMAVSVMNACFLAFYPIQFAKEGLVASVSGIMDFVTYLGNGVSSILFGVMITAWGYHAMFLVWAATSVFVIPMLFIQSKQEVSR